jgi:flagellar basal-body rod protein FlgF
MQNATYIALSGQMAISRQMDVIANNLANASTPAFKGEEMMFSQYVVERQGSSPLSFVQDAGTVRDLSEGPISQTGNPLDLAISGQGYFALQTPLGARYTRNGHFQLDSQGQVVNEQGYPLLAVGGQPLVVPSGSHGITVAPDGTVSVGADGSSAQAELGTVQLVDFANPQAVTPAANGLWVTDQQPQPASATVQQGMLEESNVKPVIELTRLLSVARQVGMVKNFLDEEDQRENNAIDKLSNVSS